MINYRTYILNSTTRFYADILIFIFANRRGGGGGGVASSIPYLKCEFFSLLRGFHMVRIGL